MTSHTRLLICNTCRTIEEMPDYEGPDDRDDVLIYLASKHRFPDGNEHFGRMGKVETKHWESESKRKQIIQQIRDSAGHTGLDQEFYDTKNNLQADAMTCWTRDHNRVKACPDYKSESKLLKPDTKDDRRRLGIKEEFRSTTYLCDFCPVKSMVQQAYFDKSGHRD